MATITSVMQEEIEKVIEEMCDQCCKWPEVYRSQFEDPDIAHEVMLDEVCETCPLCELE